MGDHHTLFESDSDTVTRQRRPLELLANEYVLGANIEVRHREIQARAEDGESGETTSAPLVTIQAPGADGYRLGHQHRLYIAAWARRALF